MSPLHAGGGTLGSVNIDIARVRVNTYKPYLDFFKKQNGFQRGIIKKRRRDAAPLSSVLCLPRTLTPTRSREHTCFCFCPWIERGHRAVSERAAMVLRELSESEWQHSFVPVLALAGSANKLGSAPGGGGGERARENAVGDVKHIMVRAGRKAQGSADPLAVREGDRVVFSAPTRQQGEMIRPRVLAPR